MRVRTWHWLLLALWFCGVGSAKGAETQPARPHLVVIETRDTLQPVRARILAAQIGRANQEHAPAILIDLSTPGGLPESADIMVDAIRRSQAPVIVWMGRPDTRVSGEGLRLMLAADYALMSPGTFLTPLWSEAPRGLTTAGRAAGSEALQMKMQADAARSGRSTVAIEELTSGIHWFSAPEAVAAGFADGVADHIPDVVSFAQSHPSHRTGHNLSGDLNSSQPTIISVNTEQQLLLALMNPDLSVLLLTLGFLLIYLEVNTPGAVVPGAAGVLLVLLAGYSLNMLPLSGAGVLLCLASIVLLLMEARLVTHGVLAAVGVLTLVAGLGLLVSGPLPQLQVSWGTAAGAGVGFGGVTASLLVLGLEARRAKVKTGSEAMLGWLAVAQTPLTPEGHILVRGELWRARLTSQESSVAAGERVKVLRADGLTLEVTAIPL